MSFMRLLLTIFVHLLCNLSVCVSLIFVKAINQYNTSCIARTLSIILDPKKAGCHERCLHNPGTFIDLLV